MRQKVVGLRSLRLSASSASARARAKWPSLTRTKARLARWKARLAEGRVLDGSQSSSSL